MSKEEWEERIVKWWKEHKDVTKYVLIKHSSSYPAKVHGIALQLPMFTRVLARKPRWPCFHGQK